MEIGLEFRTVSEHRSPISPSKLNYLSSFFVSICRHDLTANEDGYFSSILFFNAYSLGIVCAYLIKNDIKPSFIVSVLYFVEPFEDEYCIVSN